MKEIDNRGSNFYVALYWASCLAEKEASWKPLADSLKEAEQEVTKELLDCQVGGLLEPMHVAINIKVAFLLGEDYLIWLRSYLATTNIVCSR